MSHLSRPLFTFFFPLPLKQNHVSQAGLKLLILLLHQPPKCQVCRCEQPHVTFPQIILAAVWWTSKVFLFFPWWQSYISSSISAFMCFMGVSIWYMCMEATDQRHLSSSATPYPCFLLHTCIYLVHVHVFI